MSVLKLNFHGNPNIGLFCVANDSICIAGNEVPERMVRRISKELDVPVIKCNACGTSFLSIFLCMNNKFLIAPDFLFKQEIKILKKEGIDLIIHKTNHTALGNNILMNDKGMIVNPEIPDKEFESLKNKTGLKAVKSTISRLGVVGSAGIANSSSCLVHQHAKSNEMKIIEKVLKTECDFGTINLGNPFIKTGLIVNNKGYAIGDQSSGLEIAKVDELFGEKQ